MLKSSRIVLANYWKKIRFLSDYRVYPEKACKRRKRSVIRVYSRDSYRRCIFRCSKDRRCKYFQHLHRDQRCILLRYCRRKPTPHETVFKKLPPHKIITIRTTTTKPILKTTRKPIKKVTKKPILETTRKPIKKVTTKKPIKKVTKPPKKTTRKPKPMPPTSKYAHFLPFGSVYFDRLQHPSR